MPPALVLPPVDAVHRSAIGIITSSHWLTLTCLIGLRNLIALRPNALMYLPTHCIFTAHQTKFCKCTQNIFMLVYNHIQPYNALIISDWQWTYIIYLQRERRFEKQLQKKGFIIKQMCPDGACLFRAVGKSFRGLLFTNINTNI